MKSLAELIKIWESQKASLLPPAQKERVVVTFERFGVHPSEQVCQMYSMIGGFESFDNNMWLLWPLEKIEAEFPDSRSDHGILFSDYSINCWCFRLKPTAHGEMEVVLDEFDDKHPPYTVASNLQSFFDAMLSDPNSVLNIRRVAQRKILDFTVKRFLAIGAVIGGSIIALSLFIG